MANKKNFMNTPAARMLGGTISEQEKTENTVPTEKIIENTVKQEAPVVNPANIQQAKIPEQIKQAEPVKTNIQEKEPVVKVLIEMSLMDSYRINNIVNSMKLKNQGKYTKKQFYNEMIADAIKKFEYELGL